MGHAAVIFVRITLINQQTQAVFRPGMSLYCFDSLVMLH